MLTRSLFVLAATACTVGLAACAADQEDDATSGAASDLVVGRVLTPEEVADDLRAAAFAENLIGKMTCTAKYESSFRERATNGSFIGIFQIGKFHVGHTARCPTTIEALYDAKTNTQCAKGVYDAQGLKAWQAYTTHQSECDRFPAPKSSGNVALAPSSSDEDDADDETDNSVASPDTGTGCWSDTLGDQTDEGDVCNSGGPAFGFSVTTEPGTAEATRIRDVTVRAPRRSHCKEFRPLSQGSVGL